MHSALHTLSSVRMHAVRVMSCLSDTPGLHSCARGGCLFVTKMLKEGEEIRREEKEREKKMKCNKCISKYDELFLLKA